MPCSTSCYRCSVRKLSAPVLRWLGSRKLVKQLLIIQGITAALAPGERSPRPTSAQNVFPTRPSPTGREQNAKKETVQPWDSPYPEALPEVIARQASTIVFHHGSLRGVPGEKALRFRHAATFQSRIYSSRHVPEIEQCWRERGQRAKYSELGRVSRSPFSSVVPGKLNMVLK